MSSRRRPTYISRAPNSRKPNATAAIARIGCRTPVNGRVGCGDGDADVGAAVGPLALGAGPTLALGPPLDPVPGPTPVLGDVPGPMFAGVDTCAVGVGTC